MRFLYWGFVFLMLVVFVIVINLFIGFVLFCVFIEFMNESYSTFNAALERIVATFKRVVEVFVIGFFFF